MFRVFLPPLLIALAATVASSAGAPSSAADVDAAIERGVRYLDRLFWDLGDRAVMKDAPSFPLYVYSHRTRTFRQPGQESLRIVVQREGDGYSTPTLATYHVRDGDRGDFTDLILRVELATASFDPPRMRYKVGKVSGDPDRPFDLYLGDTLVVAGVHSAPPGSTWIFTKEYGYPSIRYVGRHATRLAGWLYGDLGRTTQARKLHAFMDGHGWQKEFYAPLWSRSNSYPSVPWDTQCGPSGGPISDPLYNETVFPDRQLWRALPSGPNLLPYKTQLLAPYALGCYAFISVLGDPPPALRDLIYAIHLLNIGQANAREAKRLIDRASWDGLGFRRESRDPSGVVWGRLGAYATYITAVGLAAHIRYYEVTGDARVLPVADRIAGILLALQYQAGATRYSSGKVAHWVHHEGGWLTSYQARTVVGWHPQDHGVIDQIYAVFDAIGWFKLMPSEYPHPHITNTESTILALKALRMYAALNRKPVTPHWAAASSSPDARLSQRVSHPRPEMLPARGVPAPNPP